MGMTVGIKNSGDRHLDLHFSSSNYDGKGHWGSLHIAICSMQSQGGQDVPLQMLQCELDHADIDKLIQELQAAKSLLVPDDSGQARYRRLIGSEWTACDENGEFNTPEIWQNPEHLFENSPTTLSNILDRPPPPEPDAVCCSCGFKYGEHSYSEFCIERLPDSMRRFSRTRKFTP